MKDANFNIVAGLIAIGLVLYFGWPAKAKGDDAGTGDKFVPGGGDISTGYGVTGSWLVQMKQPLV